MSAAFASRVPVVGNPELGVDGRVQGQAVDQCQYKAAFQVLPVYEMKAARSEDRHGVHRDAGAAVDRHGSGDEQELVPSDLTADLREFLDLGTVDEGHAEAGQSDLVERRCRLVQRCSRPGKPVADVAGDHRDLAVGEPAEGVEIE